MKKAKCEIYQELSSCEIGKENVVVHKKCLQGKNDAIFG